MLRFCLGSKKTIWQITEKELNRLPINVRVYMLKDQIQETETDTCGVF